MSDTPTYGVGDASYQAAGGIDGLRRLVDDFYRIMDEWPGAARIRAMHPADLSTSADKLACFLSGWLGGPKLFREKYGSIMLPHAHAPWPIDEQDSAAWLTCSKALTDSPTGSSIPPKTSPGNGKSSTCCNNACSAPASACTNNGTPVCCA